MPTSAKLIVGAVIVFFGVAGLAYSLPILSNAATNKQVAFSEAQVQKMPDNMKIFIPVVLASTGVLIVGVALVSIGVSETLLPQVDSFTPSIDKPVEESKQHEKTGTADTA